MSRGEPRARQREADWLSVEEATERIRERVRPLEGSEIVPLTAALGRVLAEEIESAISHPAWDNSAMDGFAVMAADVKGASRDSPVILEIIEEVPAGEFPTRSLRSGTAIRVMTGAPVPEGADGVTRLEHTEPGPEAGTVRVFDGADTGRNIRRKGEDLRPGDRPLAPGTRVGPAEVGVLAMMGRALVPVRRRPRVAILSTGDELADFHELARVEAGRRIMNSNSYALYAQVLEAGGEPALLGIARDDRRSLRDRLATAMGFDALITSAGLAVGDHDYVKEVLDDLGMELLFYRVNMRPGSPFTFGVLQGRPVFALPGNPVSAMVTFEVLVRPALGRMMGLAHHERPRLTVKLAERARADPRTRFYRARLERRGGEWMARLTGPQGSGILTSMVEADALIRIPASTELAAGDEVEAILLR